MSGNALVYDHQDGGGVRFIVRGKELRMELESGGIKLMAHLDPTHIRQIGEFFIQTADALDTAPDEARRAEIRRGVG
jgi:hypothetical protein